jgi:tetratricopeptide (TPR) repeat protein
MANTSYSFDRFINDHTITDADILRLIDRGDTEAMAYWGWLNANYAIECRGSTLENANKNGEPFLVRAASRGNTDAMFYLVKLYENSNNREKYLLYLKQFADFGDGNSQYELAKIFYESKNYDNFLKYAKSAAKSDDVWAKFGAESLLKNYYVDKKEYKSALFWAQQMKSPFDGSPSQKDINEVKSLMNGQKSICDARTNNCVGSSASTRSHDHKISGRNSALAKLSVEYDDCIIELDNRDTYLIEKVGYYDGHFYARCLNKHIYWPARLFEKKRVYLEIVFKDDKERIKILNSVPNGIENCAWW